MRGIPWRVLTAGVATAVLLDLPFPLAGPLPVWRTVFAWFALVPLLAELLRLPLDRQTKTLRWSFLAGWLCGAVWFGSNCYWVYNTMHLYGGMNRPMAVLSLVLFSLFLGFWFGVFGLALGLIRRVTLGKPTAWLAAAAIPFLWTAMEFAIARIPEFPWDQLGYSQVDNGLLTKLAPWTGVYGISFVLATANALLTAGVSFRRQTWTIKMTNRRPVILAGLSGKAWGVYGVVLALVGCLGFRDKPPRPPVVATAVLVQPNLNVVTDDVWVGQEWDRRIAQFGQLGSQSCTDYIAGIPETGAPMMASECSSSPALPAVIVWPESPAPFRDADHRFQSAMAGIVSADDAPLIVGDVGMDVDRAAQTYQIYNSASVVALDGHFAGRYDKIHLVPFGEYVPFRRVLFFAHQLTQNLSDMGTGADRKVFRIGSGDGTAHRYGVFICYESVFGDEVRQFARLGAEVLVNISDDGWYGDTSAPWQHLNMARMRAIENHRWILRDTNSGVTGSIDPYGTVRKAMPRHTLGVLAARFGYDSEVTFYTGHGDWLAELCAIFALGISGWAMRAVLYR